MRALLDTNIVYDILCRRPFDEEGLTQLKVMHMFSDVELWISAKSYTDLFCLMRRIMDGDQAHDLLADTLGWIKVCSVDGADMAKALDARWSDFEDCLVDICAEKVKADFLITRDRNGFERSKIPHGSASDFMGFVRERTNTVYATENVRG